MDWYVSLYLGVGLGVLLIGSGVFLVCVRLARLIERATVSLEEVDRQIAAIAPPLVRTLGHVGGIADTADTTLARLSNAVGTLESLADGVAKTASVAQNAVNPAVANLGATLTTLSSRLRRFVGGRDHVTNRAYHDENV